jgi:predicted transcriptional regulator of viral defense system
MPDHQRLYEIAEPQGGYFTAEQAREAGFSGELLSYHARAGRFERVAHGVYRLRRFPGSPYEDLFIAQLRAGAESVVSHDSALALYELSDVLPAEVHLTVPKSASRRRPGIRQHTRRIAPDEVTVWEGLRVTTVPRTLADVARSGISDDRVRQATQEAVDRGMIGDEELQVAATQYGGRAARIFRSYLRQQSP